MKQAMASTTHEIVVVDEHNIDQIREVVHAADQAAEIALDQRISTWPIFYAGNQRGQITVWHDSGRAAVFLGGESAWGRWDATRHVLILDDDGSCIDEYGE